MPNVTALVVPPFSLKNSILEQIKETYFVIEAKTLEVNEIEDEIITKTNRGQKTLVILSSLDGITEQSRLCNLKLYAYKCTDGKKGEPSSNFYLDKSSFYAHSSFQNLNSAQ